MVTQSVFVSSLSAYQPFFPLALPFDLRHFQFPPNFKHSLNSFMFILLEESINYVIDRFVVLREEGAGIGSQ